MVAVCLRLCLCRQLDWRPEKKGEVRKRHEKVVIIRNMFHPSDFEVQRDTHMHIHAYKHTHLSIKGINLCGLCVRLRRKTHWC